MGTINSMYTKDDDYYERLLNINTLHKEEENYTKGHFAPYVPSSYYFLKKYFDSNPLKDDDCFVDFGCGKGRVSIFVNYLFHCTSVGIEYDNSLFKNAIKNKEKYEIKYGKQPIEFICEHAEHLAIKEHFNVFYFYNPFSILIFSKVIRNILKIKRAQTFDIILFRPIVPYTNFINSIRGFQLIKKEIYESSDRIRNDIEFYLYRYTHP